MPRKTIPLSLIHAEPDLQLRAGLSTQYVGELALLIADGHPLPPVTVFYDGRQYFLSDGFHRFRAHENCGSKTIECDVRDGDRRAAILHAAGANARHGLRRTNDDKRHAVAIVLKDQEWSGKSDRWIAKACNVSHPLVAEVRAALYPPTSQEIQLEELPVEPEGGKPRQGLDGKTRNLPAPATKTTSNPKAPTTKHDELNARLAAAAGLDPFRPDTWQPELDRRHPQTTASTPSIPTCAKTGVGHRYDNEACIDCHEPLPEKTRTTKSLGSSTPEQVAKPGTVECHHCAGTGRLTIDDDIPAELRDPTFAQAWHDWQQHRKEKRSPLKPTTRKAQLKKLATLGPRRATETIRHSIEAGYLGLFEPPPNGKKLDNTGKVHGKMRNIF